MQINFPETISNMIEELTKKRGEEPFHTNYYLTVVTALALLRYVLNNTNERTSVVLFNKQRNEMIEEIEVND